MVCHGSFVHEIRLPLTPSARRKRVVECQMLSGFSKYKRRCVHQAFSEDFVCFKKRNFPQSGPEKHDFTFRNWKYFPRCWSSSKVRPRISTISHFSTLMTRFRKTTQFRRFLAVLVSARNRTRNGMLKACLIRKVFSSVSYCNETFWTTISLKMPKPKGLQQLVTATQHAQQQRKTIEIWFA